MKHFYANESLLKATTTMNIIGLAQELGGWLSHVLSHYSHLFLRKDFINSTEDGGLTEAAFNSFVDSLVDEIDMLPWIWNKAPDSPTSDDRFLQFRKGYSLEMCSSFTLICRYHLPWGSFPCEISVHPVW